MIIKNRVLTPGPTAILPQAQFAQAEAVMHHRTEVFEALFKEAQEGLRRFYQTDHEVLMFAASGTGAMEACVANALDRGDTAIVVVGGKFGERWAQICRAYGVTVVELALEAGRSVAPAAVADALAQHPDTRAVLVQGCETSTGALMDIPAIAALVRERPACLLMVDGITWLGAHVVKPDELGIDLLVCGSQKALAMPPGLASVSISPRAWERVGTTRNARYYLSFLEERKAQRKGTTAWTPAISLIAAACASLRWINGLPRGVETLAQNAEVLARCTRAGVTALGLAPFAECPANAVTAVRAPAGHESGVIIKAMQQRFGAVIANGQDELQGKIFRIGHLGYTDFFDCLGVIGGLEQVLQDLGHAHAVGAGLAAAQAEYRKACEAAVPPARK